MNLTAPVDLEKTLVQIGQDSISHANAFEGIHAFGQPGAGKSSTTLDLFARAMLGEGWGGIWLCAKTDEKDTAIKLAQKMGRADDLIIFAPHEKWRLNFLEYESQRTGAEAASIANMLDVATEISNGGKDKQDYWKQASRQMITNAAEILLSAYGKVTLRDLYRFILSAPQYEGQQREQEWQDKSFCYQSGFLAEENRPGPDVDLASLYWMEEFPGMDARPRSSIVSQFTAMASGLMRGTVGELLCTTTNITPEATFKGAILVLDVSERLYGKPGLIGQGLIRHIWQRAVERRDLLEHPRPVFCIADEAQVFINTYDRQFMGTARSKRACSLYLTQNISAYYAQMGGESARAETDALLGNFNTKIFHLNGDAVTNEWASKQMGHEFKTMVSSGTSQNAGMGQGSNANVSKQRHA